MEENERALKRMQKRLHEAEWRLLRGENEVIRERNDPNPLPVILFFCRTWEYFLNFRISASISFSDDLPDSDLIRLRFPMRAYQRSIRTML